MDARVSENQKLQNFSALNAKAYAEAQQKSPAQRSHSGAWTNVGPFDQYGSDVWSSGGMGRVVCTAFHPTNSSIFWVGTAAGGLWKTTNGGNTWTPMTDAFTSIGITAIVVDQSNANIIYVLTGDGHAYDAPLFVVLYRPLAAIPTYRVLLFVGCATMTRPNPP